MAPVRRVLSRIAATSLLLAAGAAAPSGAAPAKLPPGVAERLQSVARAGMERLRLPALSLAVARGGDLVFSRAFGTADLEGGIAATPATRFRTASVAKSLTATAVMRLAEQGRLDLDAPIQRYCPSFPVKPWPVTARQLLVHTSGVRHYERRGESAGGEHFFTIEDALALFEDDPLLFEPGTRFGYSTYGYMVLGCALEGASGVPYDELMASLVYEPAGMIDTVPDHHYAIVPGRARPYLLLTERDHQGLPPAARAQARAGEVYNANFHDTSMKRAAGGLLSTAEDLVRFALAFQAGRLVGPETARAMWSVQSDRGGNPLETPWGPIGIGWFVRGSVERREIYSSGGQVGGRASLYVYPDDDLVLAVMTNLTDAELVPLEQELLSIVLPGYAPAPRGPIAH